MIRLGLAIVLLSVAGICQEVHTEYSRTRFEVIVPLLRQYRLSDAEQLTRELLAKAESHLDRDSLETGRICSLLTDILVRQGKSGEPETLRLALRAHEIKTKVLGESLDETLRATSMYATVLFENGQPALSRSIYDRLAQVYEHNLPPQSPMVIEGLCTLSAQLLRAGQPEQARSFAEKALDMAERRVGRDSAEAASALSVLGFVKQALGEENGALLSLERALEINEKILGSGHRLTIASYNNMAIQLTRSGNYVKARSFYERANAAREKLLGPDHPDIAYGYHNLGIMLRSTGDYLSSKASLEKALEIRLRTLGEVRTLTGMTLGALAETAFDLKDYQQALQYADRALASLKATVGEHDSYYQTVASIRAFILEKTAGPVAAFHQAVIAARFRNEFVRLSTQGVAERTALSYFVEPERNGSDLAMSLALQEQTALGSGAIRDAWDLRIHSRAMVLDEMSARRRLASYAAGPELMALRQTLLDSRRSLARLVLSGNSTEGSAERISDTIRIKEKAERELGARSLELRRDIQRGDLGFAEVADHLPPRAVLVSYVRFQRHPDRKPWIVALVLRAGSEEPSLIPIGPDGEIDTLVATWRQRVGLAAADPTRAGKRIESLARTAGEALRRRVWDPLSTQLRGANLVFVVPDGALHLVNFVALPAAGDAERYLVESGPTIHILASERDLVLKMDDHPARQSNSMLALGNPAFDGARLRITPQSSATSTLRSASPACADLKRLRFSALPASGVETAEISRLWTGPQRPLVLSGAAANETAFRIQAPGRRVIHIATHGFFLGQQCGAGGLLGEAAQQSPLVLSGLALAGANRRENLRDDEEDGLLTAEEVAGLNLEGVEWVVLSGCDTGLGQIRGAEGVLGLRRAFQTAGAATVIVSLWPVEDAAAREWMKALYENRLKRGQSTAEALRDASRTILKARRLSGRSTHPFFWAAFVGAGDWR